MKLIGCVILFLAVLQIGMRKVEKLRYGGALLSDLWFAISEIGRQIALSQAPLPEIYKELAKSGNGHTELFDRLCATEDFSKVYGELRAVLPRPTELDSMMRKFLRVLGKTEAEGQVALCRETAAQLKQALEENQSTFAAKRKMYLAVAACVGGMLVLFML